jgi:hypothetical protein
MVIIDIMNKASTSSNPYQLPRIILAPVSDEIQLEEDLEPPFVRVRDTNSQYLQIDTSTAALGTNPAQVVITLSRVMPRVNRLKIVFFSFRDMTPNINIRNNVFTFIRGGVPFTATIPEGNLNGIARYNALAAAMSAATGVPGEFIANLSTVYPSSIFITNTAVTPFRFINTGSGIIRGRYLWGFNPRNYGTGTDAVAHLLTYFNENYTRYIDIASFELTQYTKIDTSGSRVSAEVVFRQFLTDVTLGQLVFTGFTQSPSLNYNRSRALGIVDLEILDEFGEIYYIPQQFWDSFCLTVVMIAEM